MKVINPNPLSISHYLLTTPIRSFSSTLFFLFLSFWTNASSFSRSSRVVIVKTVRFPFNHPFVCRLLCPPSSAISTPTRTFSLSIFGHTSVVSPLVILYSIPVSCIGHRWPTIIAINLIFFVLRILRYCATRNHFIIHQYLSLVIILFFYPDRINSLFRDMFKGNSIWSYISRTIEERRANYFYGHWK